LLLKIQRSTCDINNKWFIFFALLQLDQSCRIPLECFVLVPGVQIRIEILIDLNEMEQCFESFPVGPNLIVTVISPRCKACLSQIVLLLQLSGVHHADKPAHCQWQHRGFGMEQVASFLIFHVFICYPVMNQSIFFKPCLDADDIPGDRWIIPLSTERPETCLPNTTLNIPSTSIQLKIDRYIL